MSAVKLVHPTVGTVVEVSGSLAAKFLKQGWVDTAKPVVKKTTGTKATKK